MVTRGRRREVVLDPSGEVVIDLTTAKGETREPAADADTDVDAGAAAESRSSRAL